MLLAFPMIEFFMDRTVWEQVCFAILFPKILVKVRWILGEESIISFLLDQSRAATYIPIVLSGIMCAQHDLIYYMMKVTNRVPKAVTALCSIGGIVFLGMIRLRFRYYSGISLDILYAPCIVLCIVVFIKTTGWKAGVIVKWLASNSMRLWFLHGIFFTPNKSLQAIAYFPRNPVLIVLWVILLLSPICKIVSIQSEWILGRVFSCDCRR